jgi:hypothetical protein
VYENTFQSPLSTHHFVDSYIADLETTTAPKERNEQTRIINNSRWIPPQPGIAKINVDAAISKNGGLALWRQLHAILQALSWVLQPWLWREYRTQK